MSIDDWNEIRENIRDFGILLICFVFGEIWIWCDIKRVERERAERENAGIVKIW
jgi:hypothetical protein